jgi:hypothetical protein
MLGSYAYVESGFESSRRNVASKQTTKISFATVVILCRVTSVCKNLTVWIDNNENISISCKKTLNPLFLGPRGAAGRGGGSQAETPD